MTANAVIVKYLPRECDCTHYSTNFVYAAALFILVSRCGFSLTGETRAFLSTLMVFLQGFSLARSEESFPRYKIF